MLILLTTKLMLLCYIHVCLNIEDTNGNDDDGDSESNTGVIIGGIIVGLGGLIIVLTSTTVIIMCWRNNRKRSANIGKNYWDDVCKGVGTGLADPATAGSKFLEPTIKNISYSYL